MKRISESKVEYNLRLAEEITNKLIGEAIPQKIVAGIGTDLSDVAVDGQFLGKKLLALIKHKDMSMEQIGPTLTEIQTDLDHMEWHIRSARRNLKKIISYCYRKAA